MYIYTNMSLIHINKIRNLISKLKCLPCLRDQFKDSLPGPTSPRFTEAHGHCSFKGGTSGTSLMAPICGSDVGSQLPAPASLHEAWGKGFRYTRVAMYAHSFETWKRWVWAQQFPQRTRGRLGRRVWQEGGDLLKKKKKKQTQGGGWMAQSVKHLTSAQVVLLRFVILEVREFEPPSPTSGSVLTSVEPASDALSPSLCPSPTHTHAHNIKKKASTDTKNIFTYKLTL